MSFPEILGGRAVGKMNGTAISQREITPAKWFKIKL